MSHQVEHCPGVKSEQAGKAAACDDCPSKKICATAPKGPDPDMPLIDENLADVDLILVVLSGKGGVGKSTFASQLAYWFALDESRQVGVLDLDICGPSLPVMLGCPTERLHHAGRGWSPVYVQDNLSVASIGFLLENEESAVIWRGPKKTALIKQFLKDVDWGPLDILLIDTPPGTSDEHLSIHAFLKKKRIGALLITTPQEMALQDVRKEIDFCKKIELPIVGIVENMNGFTCPKCHKSSVVFNSPSIGGASSMAESLGIPYLGSLPLDPCIGKASDMGQSLFSNCVSSSFSLASGAPTESDLASLTHSFEAIAHNILLQASRIVIEN